MRTVVLAALLAVIAVPVSAQNFDPIQFHVDPLADGLLLLRGAGGNIVACEGDDGLLLVDSDYREMSDKLLAVVDSLGAPVRRVVNTHWHFDHVGGNEALAGTGAVIMAHPNVKAYMTGDLHLDVIDSESPAWPEAALPTEVVGSPTTFAWGDETVELTPAAGHTGGDLIVWFRDADVVHVGDLIFSGGYPYIDTRHGGRIDGVIRELTQVLARCDADTRIVPGHGPLLDREGLRAYVAMLSEYRDIVAAEMEAGKGLAEIVEAKPAAHIDAEWGARMLPPELLIEEIWLSLGGEPAPEAEAGEEAKMTGGDD